MANPVEHWTVRDPRSVPGYFNGQPIQARTCKRYRTCGDARQRKGDERERDEQQQLLLRDVWLPHRQGLCHSVQRHHRGDGERDWGRGGQR